MFLDSVYIGFDTFVLPKKHPGRISSVFWGSKTRAYALGAPLRPASSPPCLASPPRPAPLVPAPPRPPVGCPGFGFDESCKTCPGIHEFADVPCLILLHITKHRFIDQQTSRKRGYRPANKPLINRSSTGYRVSWLGLHRICFGRASEEVSRTVVFVVLGVEMEDHLLAESLRAALPRSRLAPPALRLAPLRLKPPRPALLGPAPPCAAPHRPARGISRIWIRQIRSNSSEKMSRIVVFVVLEIEMEGRPLADPLRAALPCSHPASLCSSRLAPNRSAWSRPSYVRVVDSPKLLSYTCLLNYMFFLLLYYFLRQGGGNKNIFTSQIILFSIG